MKHILHIVDNLSAASGVTSVLQSLHNNLSRDEFHFDYLVINDYKCQRCDLQNTIGTNVYFLHSPKTPILFYRDLFTFLIKTRGCYFAAHIHTPTLAFFLNLPLSLFGIKHRICHIHSTKLSEIRIKELRNIPLFLFSKLLTTRYIACSHSAISSFQNNHLLNKRDKFEIIQNSINTKNYIFDNFCRISARESMGISPDSFILMQIGRLTANKNHIFSIELLKHLDPKFHLVIVGEGPTNHLLQNEATIHHLGGRIHFLGIRKDIPFLLNAADIVLLPSISEGLPIVALEAQSNGVPVLLSDTITREVGILKETHFLPLNNPHHWINKINLISSLHIDRISSNQILTNSQYSSNVAIGQLEKFYRNL